MKKCCDLKGFLSFQVLRLIKQQSRSGDEIREELERRRGTKPSPGTIYPVLKELKKNGWIEEIESPGKEKKYRITQKGKRELENTTKKFIALCCELKEDFDRIG